MLIAPMFTSFEMVFGHPILISEWDDFYLIFFYSWLTVLHCIGNMGSFTLQPPFCFRSVLIVPCGITFTINEGTYEDIVTHLQMLFSSSSSFCICSKPLQLLYTMLYAWVMVSFVFGARPLESYRAMLGGIIAIGIFFTLAVFTFKVKFPYPTVCTLSNVKVNRLYPVTILHPHTPSNSITGFYVMHSNQWICRGFCCNYLVCFLLIMR